MLNFSDLWFVSLWRSAAKVFGLVSVSYLGVEGLVSSARDYVSSALGNVGGEFGAFVSILGVPTAVNIIFAGIAARLVLGVWRAIIPG